MGLVAFFYLFVIHAVELMPFYIQDVSVKLEMAALLKDDYSAPMKYFYEGLLPSKYHTFLKLCSWLFIYGLLKKPILILSRRLNQV